MKKGLLLVNLGTPSACSISEVRVFLKEFLSDKRVIDLPAFFRMVLLYTIILPFRAKQTTKAYQLIWEKDGSPLLKHSLNIKTKYQETLGTEWEVALGMRYGNPDLNTALKQLENCQTIILLPLFPQYASSSTGSTIEEVLRLLQGRTVFPFIHVIRDFYWHSSFISAQASLIEPYISTHEHILFSYHSIPERQLLKMGCKTPCLEPCNTAESPIDRIVDKDENDFIKANSNCYRAQCYITSSKIAEKLNLPLCDTTTAFQSRIGKIPWVKPYTDEMLSHLAQRGIKKLLVVCPSFITDCLETLEEIKIRAAEQWRSLGGEGLTTVPCVNANSIWIDGFSLYLKDTST